MAGHRTHINIFLQDKAHTDAKIVSVLRKTTLAAFLEKAVNDAVAEDKSVIRDLISK